MGLTWLSDLSSMLSTFVARLGFLHYYMTRNRDLVLAVRGANQLLWELHPETYVTVTRNQRRHRNLWRSHITCGLALSCFQRWCRSILIEWSLHPLCFLNPTCQSDRSVSASSLWRRRRYVQDLVRMPKEACVPVLGISQWCPLALFRLGFCWLSRIWPIEIFPGL